MHCPRCRHSDFEPNGTCPKCGYNGDPIQINELSRLNWLLSKMESWVKQGILMAQDEQIKDPTFLEQIL